MWSNLKPHMDVKTNLIKFSNESISFTYVRTYVCKKSCRKDIRTKNLYV